MQEDQDVSACLPRPHVHLDRATARGNEQMIAKRSSKLARAILAAAVDDNDLVSRGAQRRERLERGADARGLVENRHDDAQPRIQAWNRSTLRRSPSGA